MATPRPAADPVARRDPTLGVPPTPLADVARRAFGRMAAVSIFGSPMWLAGCATPAPGAMAADKAGPDPARDYRIANRVSWGVTDGELAAVGARGPEAYIRAQLHAAAGPLPADLQARIDAASVQRRTPLDLWAEIESARRDGEAQAGEPERLAAKRNFQQAQDRLAQEAETRRLLRALHSPNQLLEQMQWFWFNHFNVYQHKGNLRVMLADYEEQAIRPHALGRFRDLLGAVSVHPAMLRYLDNEHNAVGHLNENQARELLELHTLGLQGGYTQGDVQELARVLTGHGLNFGDRQPRLRRDIEPLYLRRGAYEFNPARHDFGAKQLLGQGVPGRGAAELDGVLDRLAAHPATARFVSRKIARQFLADEPPAGLVTAMSAAWLRSDGQIAEVLGVLLRSPAFAAPGPGRFKDPVHYVVSAVRACCGQRRVQDTAPIQAWLRRLGQGLYDRQTPDGYPADAAAWSSSGQMAARLDIAGLLARGGGGLFRAAPLSADAGQPQQPPDRSPDVPALARQQVWQVLRPQLALATRQALDAAASPRDWDTLYLSAPEFMYS